MSRNKQIVVYSFLGVVLIGIFIAGPLIVYNRHVNEMQMLINKKNRQIHLDDLNISLIKVYIENNNNFNWIKDGDQKISSALSADYVEKVSEEFDKLNYKTNSEFHFFNKNNSPTKLRFDETSEKMDIKIRKHNRDIIIYVADKNGKIYEPTEQEKKSRLWEGPSYRIVSKEPKQK